MPSWEPFAADTGLLDTAERRSRVGDQAAIEPDHSRLDGFRRPQASSQVARVEVGGQTVDRVVGQGDCLIVIVEVTTGATGPKISCSRIAASGSTPLSTVGS